MATSVFFNNFNHIGEQTLLEDLNIEAIRIFGIDTYYIPRTIDHRDDTFREGELISFNKALMVEMYIKNIHGFGGDGKFVSQFGYEIRDEMTMACAVRVWNSEVGEYVANKRPNEGDLIYFPLNNKCFQINFVNHEPVFYQLGTLAFYEMQCELFEYSHETFNTGIPELDKIYTQYSLDMAASAIQSEDGTLLATESGDDIIDESYNEPFGDPASQNKTIEKNADIIMDFDENDPFSEGNY